MQKTLTNLIVASVAMLAAVAVQAQGTPLAVELLPLGKDLGITGGQTVTPAYEGWYETEDGSIALSFGYYNRNTQEVLDIPTGPANRIIGAPDGEANQGQATHFVTGRHWGVFTVKIPADYKEQVVWHLQNQGKTFHIPANLKADYIIDAIAGDASGNFPPEIRFQEGGPMGHGPGGITTGPLRAKVGEPLTIDAWAKDDGVGGGLIALFLGGAADTPPLDLAWFQHQGPGEVTFSEPSAKVPVAGGKASTEVTFSQAGDYLLRVRLTEIGGPETAGHSQCCWSNSFVKVNVSN
ncbi:MAG: hypothetical protein HQ498_12235 [Pseudohongiella sp.]|nr:hypothetical protein [Pseudohongiella sp.]